MKNILAFGASSSINSINKKFANYSSKQIPNSRTNLLDLNDFEMPIFSIDKALAIFAVLLDKLRHQRRPPGLVARAQSRAIVPMEILVEQHQVFPVGVALQGPGAAVSGPMARFVGLKNAD